MERNSSMKKSGNNYLKKIVSMEDLARPPSCSAFVETVSFGFETRKSFKNYFPDKNSQIIIKNVNKKNQMNGLKNKENQRKIMENKLRLAKYTFYVEEMRKHMVDQLKKRSSLAKKKRKNGIFGEFPMVRLLPLKKKTSIKLADNVKIYELAKRFRNNSLKKKFKISNKL